jgi:hypothetical protein
VSRRYYRLNGSGGGCWRRHGLVIVIAACQFETCFGDLLYTSETTPAGVNVSGL